MGCTDSGSNRVSDVALEAGAADLASLAFSGDPEADQRPVDHCQRLRRKTFCGHWMECL